MDVNKILKDMINYDENYGDFCVTQNEIDKFKIIIGDFIISERSKFILPTILEDFRDAEFKIKPENIHITKFDKWTLFGVIYSESHTAHTFNVIMHKASDMLSEIYDDDKCSGRDQPITVDVLKRKKEELERDICSSLMGLVGRFQVDNEVNLSDIYIGFKRFNESDGNKGCLLLTEVVCSVEI